MQRRQVSGRRTIEKVKHCSAIVRHTPAIYGLQNAAGCDQYIENKAQILGQRHECRMHCQRLELGCHGDVSKLRCRSFLCCARQISSALINSKSCLGQRRAQVFATQKGRSKLQCRLSRFSSASAAPGVMFDELSQAVDLKQACLIAAGVYCLWRLASFSRCLSNIMANNAAFCSKALLSDEALLTLQSRC